LGSGFARVIFFWIEAKKLAADLPNGASSLTPFLLIFPGRLIAFPANICFATDARMKNTMNNF
jgi:hypothetical protein